MTSSGFRPLRSIGMARHQPRRGAISPFRSNSTARPPTGWNTSATNSTTANLGPKRKYQNLCTTRRLIPQPAQHRRWPPPPSRVAIRPITTCKSRFCSVASATPTSIRSATSGGSSCRQSTRLSPAMRSLGVSPKSSRLLPSTSRATSPRYAAWSIRTAPFPDAKLGWRTSARTGGARRKGTRMRPHVICHMLSSVDGKIDGAVLKAAIEQA